jgi:hypothetical protein
VAQKTLESFDYFGFTEYFVGDLSNLSLQSAEAKTTRPLLELLWKISRAVFPQTGHLSLMGG